MLSSFTTRDFLTLDEPAIEALLGTGGDAERFFDVMWDLYYDAARPRIRLRKTWPALCRCSAAMSGNPVAFLEHGGKVVDLEHNARIFAVDEVAVIRDVLARATLDVIARELHLVRFEDEATSAGYPDGWQTATEECILRDFERLARFVENCGAKTRGFLVYADDPGAVCWGD